VADSPYIVLARKHRPKHFADVVGQEHVGQTLANAISQNRVAHALLFTGPRGVGKTSTARILARALNCQTGPTPTPCDECAACIDIAKGSSVDVIEIDAASNRGIDEIRELRDAVRYPPSNERFKVYIIDEVHMLTTPAFNALLKTLEEPPPHIVFVFATTEPHKIPATILSRCQRYDFRRIPEERIEAHLREVVEKEGVEADDGALRMVAQQSEGCMRDAQSQLDQLISFAAGKIDAELASRVLGVVGRDSLFRLTDALLERDVDAVLEIVERAYEVGANLVRFTTDLLTHIRDLTVAAVSRGQSSVGNASSDERAQLAAQASRTTPSVLHRLFALLMQSAEEMSKSSHPRLVLEMTLIRMTAIEPVQPVAELIARLEALAKSDVREPVSEVQNPKSEVQNPKSEVQNPKSEVQNPKSEIGNRKSEVQNRKSETGNRKSEIGNRKPEGVRQPPTDQRSAWAQLVSAVNRENPRVGSLLKVAQLQPGEGLSFSIQLAGAQADLLRDVDRLSLVQRTGKTLWGADVGLVIENIAADDEANGPSYSIDSEEHEARERERERRADAIAKHPATGVIQDIFQPTDMRVRPHAVEDDGLTDS